MTRPHANATTPTSLDELLSFHDRPFVDAAYLSLLGRPADALGLEGYVQQLRQGVSREHLIVALAECEEGLRHDQKLPGLTRFIAIHRLRKPSLLARLISRVGKRLNNSQEATLRALTNNLAALTHRLDERDLDWQSRLQASYGSAPAGPLSGTGTRVAEELEAMGASGSFAAARTTILLQLATGLRSASPES